VSLLRDDVVIFAGESRGEMAGRLMNQALFHLAVGNSAGLLLHCAVLVRNSIGIILPGVSGAGKSTFAVWLARNGFRYLTDELAFIETGTQEVHAFTRPINIKKPALGVLNKALEVDTERGDLISSELATLIPHRQINSDFHKSIPELGMILYPRYSEGSEFKLNSITPALAGLDLMKCLINARNLSGHGFPEITRIAKNVPAYSMVYGGFEQLGKDLFDLFDSISV
jgi:hypothetical protein